MYSFSETGMQQPKRQLLGGMGVLSDASWAEGAAPAAACQP